MDDPRDLDAEAVAHGIHRLPVSTPFAVGQVNCYLIDDEPLTLLDTGPNSGTGFDELVAGIESTGHTLGQIERVVISHQHIDHLGLASLVAKRSGAEVVCLDLLAPYLEQFEERAKADDEFAARLMTAHGVPPDVVAALQSVTAAFRAWGASAPMGATVSDGGTLDFAGRSFGVHHRPGHSPTDTVFADPATGVALVADHLLPHISSNPLATKALDGSDERPHALVNYIDSLRATRAMDLDLLLPGHGEPFTNHAELIDARFRLHERRAEKLHGLIAERPRSAHELAQAIWGNIAVTQAFLTLSEVLGHVDLLVRDGRVREVAGQPITFAPNP